MPPMAGSISPLRNRKICSSTCASASASISSNTSTPSASFISVSHSTAGPGTFRPPTHRDSLILRMLSESPFILYSDGKGNIFEDTSLYVTGRSGWDALPVPSEDWIPLPDGGSLYELPGRRGIGIDVMTGEMRLCARGWAVAAFIPPAHTGLYLAA